jgi:hypothetical protein
MAARAKVIARVGEPDQRQPNWMRCDAEHIRRAHWRRRPWIERKDQRRDEIAD